MLFLFLPCWGGGGGLSSPHHAIKVLPRTSYFSPSSGPWPPPWTEPFRCARQSLLCWPASVPRLLCRPVSGVTSFATPFRPLGSPPPFFLFGLLSFPLSHCLVSVALLVASASLGPVAAPPSWPASAPYIYSCRLHLKTQAKCLAHLELPFPPLLPQSAPPIPLPSPPHPSSQSLAWLPIPVSTTASLRFNYLLSWRAICSTFACSQTRLFLYVKHPV